MACSINPESLKPFIFQPIPADYPKYIIRLCAELNLPPIKEEAGCST